MFILRLEPDNEKHSTRTWKKVAVRCRRIGVGAVGLEETPQPQFFMHLGKCDGVPVIATVVGDVVEGVAGLYQRFHDSLMLFVFNGLARTSGFGERILVNARHANPRAAAGHDFQVLPPVRRQIVGGEKARCLLQPLETPVLHRCLAAPNPHVTAKAINLRREIQPRIMAEHAE